MEVSVPVYAMVIYCTSTKIPWRKTQKLYRT